MPTIGQLTFGDAAPCTAVLYRSDKIVTTFSCFLQSNDNEGFDPTETTFRFFPTTGGPERSVQVLDGKSFRTASSFREMAPATAASFDFAIFKLARLIPSTLGQPISLALTVSDRVEVGLFSAPDAPGGHPTLRLVCKTYPVYGVEIAIECPQEESFTGPFPVFAIVGGRLELATIVTMPAFSIPESPIVGARVDRFDFLHRGFRDTSRRIRIDNHLDVERDIGARFIRP